MSPITTEAAPVAITQLPTQYDLPCDDGIPMETQRHFMQMQMLIDTLFSWLAQREDGYVGGNMFLYFSAAQLKNEDFRGPDVFVVLGVPKGERRSWVVWDEEQAPNVIIELLSESTATNDKTKKKQVYQDKVRVPEYFWYDPFNSEDWAGFNLQNGVYQPINKDEQERLVSQQLGLALVRWQGYYKDVEATWLRWATLEGDLIPTPQEEAEQAQQQAEQVQQQAAQAQQQAEQAQQRAEQLAARLRAMGINPDEI
ncbi:MAG: Uma2 family endonuclease [Symploca sp. SIO2C1]|nr:Uma2 family endonuclease [Symploca sp. SIO2C1]